MEVHRAGFSSPFWEPILTSFTLGYHPSRPTDTLVSIPKFAMKTRSKRLVVWLTIAIVGLSCQGSQDYQQLKDGSCTYGVQDLGGDVRLVTKRKNWREWHWKDPPPKPLRIRKSDLRRYPRSDFRLVLEDSRGGRIDTSSETATIDMVVDPDTTIALQLTAAEIDTIYQAAIAMRIFDYPEPHPVLETTGGGICPDNVFYLRVEAGGHVRNLQWSTHYRPGGKNVGQWQRLDALTRLVYRTVAARPEFRALPERRGAYM